MPGEIIPTKETDIPAWLTNFATIATANATMLALPANTVQDLNTRGDLLSSPFPTQ